ncbi:MAG TPA: hypothetical protein VKS22_14640 [Candidatus Binataceae bacterium]|nr:hypothetical protein [Candidatus Binataceae bacterium]
MADPITIKSAQSAGKILTRLRQAWQHIKRIEQLIAHADNLEQRVSELEKRLERCPGEACPKCRELTFVAVKSEFAGMGEMRRTMRCTECGFTELWWVASGKAVVSRK